VTAREDQAQSIVRDGHLVVRIGARLDRRQLDLHQRVVRQFLGLLTQAPTAAQAIDRAIPRRRRDPGTRVRRDAPVGPDLQGGDERVLDRFLGEVEVAEDADERRDRPPLLLPEQAVDGLVGGGVAQAQPAVAPTEF
jgi:hypothetical protein